MHTYLHAVLLAVGALGTTARAQELAPHPWHATPSTAREARPPAQPPVQALAAPTITAERVPLAPLCSQSLRDQADPGSCVEASSAPAFGTLYPLGPEFNIDPAGNVGIGTLAPEHRLDVAGDIGGSGGLELGDLASIGSANTVVDLSYTISDFAGAPSSFPFLSTFVVDPTEDLSAGGLHSHTLHEVTEQTNPFDVGALHGTWMQTSHHGTGTVASLGATESYSKTRFTGHTNIQFGISVESMALESGTIDQNRAIDVYSGHAGGGGWITDNYGVFVGPPYSQSPIGNNYGIFLGDQTVASGNNYAIYSEGGGNYFAGNVGIGVLPSGYALQVGEPGDGSEARANAWNLLSSREYKRDVEALDEEALDEILAKIEATDVVHYRYVDDDHLRLGVIAEESPEEILSRDKQGVSLGDYSAFLLAGIKAQQRELREQGEAVEALRAELAELRASVEQHTR